MIIYYKKAAMAGFYTQCVINRFICLMILKNANLRYYNSLIHIVLVKFQWVIQ